jgi:periplasmic protein TonB
MDASQRYAGYELKDELARYCLPGAKRDSNRKLAWTNSICIFFLLIGILGAKRGIVSIKAPPPVEEIIPTMIEPAAPPPTTETQQKDEQTDEEKPEVPQVVVVTPNSPAINFAVPTIGNVVVPNALASAPPAAPMKPLTPARSQPTAINTTGKGGDRPQPPYPKIALEQGEQGTVILSLTVEESGVVSAIQVKESSGYPLLDRSTLEYVKRHWIFPPGGGARIYEAPIKYVLN